MRGYLIVVEGLDFAGKTTIGRLLLAELDAAGLPAVHNTAKDRRLRRWSKQLAASRRAPVVVADLLFLLAVLHDTARIARRLRRGVTVVQDRYYPSYVWNQLAIPRRGAHLWVRLYRLLRPLFLDPDLVVYCRCTADTLQARYLAEQRRAPGALSPNDRTVFSEEGERRLVAYDRIFARVLADEQRVVTIDNDGTLDELEAAVRRVLGGDRPLILHE